VLSAGMKGISGVEYATRGVCGRGRASGMWV